MNDTFSSSWKLQVHLRTWSDQFSESCNTTSEYEKNVNQQPITTPAVFYESSNLIYESMSLMYFSLVIFKFFTFASFTISKSGFFLIIAFSQCLWNVLISFSMIFEKLKSIILNWDSLLWLKRQIGTSPTLIDIIWACFFGSWAYRNLIRTEM